MRFDWQKFCIRNGIPFVTYGPNTAAGNISIHCPFCGNADTSMHMGLRLDVKFPAWGCFRNRKHGGRDPAYLVAKLLNIHIVAAKALIEIDAPPIDDFDSAVERLREPATTAHTPSKHKPRTLTLPKECRPLSDCGIYAGQFITYLAERGFGKDALDVATTYGLTYALTGEQAWRLVLPIELDGQLIGWTGRAIRPGTLIRYKTSSGFGKDVVMQRPRPATVIAITEGPLDYLKLDYYGRPFGVRACATMGTAVTAEQLAVLRAMRKDGTRLVMVFDQTAMAENISIADEIGATWARLPDGIKDPGELSPADAKIFCKKLASLI
jgi:hypothetical protein